MWRKGVRLPSNGNGTLPPLPRHLVKVVWGTLRFSELRMHCLHCIRAHGQGKLAKSVQGIRSIIVLGVPRIRAVVYGAPVWPFRAQSPKIQGVANIRLSPPLVPKSRLGTDSHETQFPLGNGVSRMGFPNRIWEPGRISIDR
jgi:hypothetical protein